MPLLGLSDDAKRWLASDVTDGLVQTDFNENAEAAWGMARDNMIFGARARLINREFDALFEENNKKLMAVGSEPLNRRELIDAMVDVQDTGGIFGGTQAFERHQAAIDELRKKDASILSWQDMEEEARKRAIGAAQATRHTYEDVSSRAGTGGTLGGLVGIGAGMSTDPINIGVTLATLPIALEGWGAAILGNAAINATAETLIQFAPGGARDWAAEQGLSPEAINAETRMAIGGAAAGGAVIGGFVHGAGKGIRWLGEKVFSRNPMEARSAVNRLLDPENAHHLTPEQLDQLTLIQRAQQLEDTAAFNVLNTRFTHVDGEAIIKNLERYNEVARAIVDDSFEPRSGAITNESVDVLRQRALQVDTILSEIRGGIDSQALDDLMRTFLPEERYNRFRELVDEYRASGGDNRLGGLARAEEIIKGHEQQVADIRQSATDAASQLDRMREIHGQKTKDLSDLDAILKDLDTKKAKIEKDVLDLHAGKWGQIDEFTRNQIHDDLMSRAKALDTERADYLRERERLVGEIDEFGSKLAKAERRAERDTAPKVEEAERSTANDLELSREAANVASKPEMAAAREILHELKWIEENKISYAELFASNPLADASRLREAISIIEMRNRLRDGDEVSLDDFLSIVTRDDAERFNEHLKASNDLGKAVDALITDIKSAFSDAGKETLERVAKNINEILARFEEPMTMGDLFKSIKAASDHNREVNPSQFAAQVRELASNPETRELVDQFIDQNLNTKVIDPDTGVEISMADFLKDVREKEDMIALIEACKV